MIRDKPHTVFERANSDLIYRVKLSIKQALLGTLIVIPFLDSTKPPYQLRTNQEILTPQTEKHFPNEGLPYPKDPTRRGDLIVRFDILFPQVLNNEQRTLVDCCFSNSMDFYQPHNSVLHTTILQSTQQQPQSSPKQQQKPSSQIPRQPPPQQQSVPNPLSTPPLKPQTSPSTTSNSNNNHPHQKPVNRHVNGNGRHKSPISPNKNGNKPKVSPLGASTTVPPPGPSSSPTTVFTTETSF
jgi:hypothetical protein